MIKRLISVITAVSCAAMLALPVFGAGKLNIEQDFENFTPDSSFSAKEGGYEIKSDISSYLAVPSSAAAGNAPVLEVNYGQNFTFEFDAKNGGAQQSIIEAQFEGGNYFRLFTLLADGRGPILRFSDESPIFLYNTSDTKPDVTSWNNYKIEFNYQTKTMSVYVNGELIETYYDRNYSPVEPAFPGTNLLRLRFFMDPTKTGEACYDNIRLYTESASQGVEFADDFYKEAFLKLSALDGIPDSAASYPMEQNLTRGEFTEMVLKTLGISVSSSSKQVYKDVGPEHNQYAAINMANMMGYVSDAENFRPDDPIKFSEAVTILCNVNGYSRMADINGGWPGGYINMAYEYDLTDNIKVIDQRQLMNMKDSCILLANALTAPMMKVTVTGVGEAQYSEDEDETILSKFHGLKEIECFVDKYNSQLKQVSFTERKTGNSYSAVYSADGIDVENTMQYAWVDEDYEVIRYMYPAKDSAVVYGYIRAVNSSDAEKEYSVGEIRNVETTNCVRTALAPEAVVTLNGEEITAPFKPIGMYSRIVVTKGEISRLDLYEIVSGGMIESASEEKIVYINGAMGYSVLEDVNETKPLKVILDNAAGNVKSLKANTYFDYIWIDGGLMIVASTQKAEGILTSAGADTITISTEEKEVTYNKPISQFYISADGIEEYSSENSASTYLNSEVTVYADANGMARYMKAGSSGTFYGVVIRYDDENVESKYPNLTVARIENGAVAEKVYEVNIKDDELYYPEVGYYDAVMNCRKTDGSGVYKFTEKNGIIRKIEEVEWYSGGAVTLGDKFDYRAVRVYFDGSWKGVNQNQILILKNGLGEFEVRKVEWSDLVNKFANGAKALVEKTEPISNIMILTEYETSVYQDATQFGFIESDNEYYGSDDQLHTKYVISKQGVTSTVDLVSDYALKYNGTPIGKNDFIIYSPGSLNKESSGMIIKGVINMGGQWQEQTVSSLKLIHMGAYTGTTSGYLKTTLNGETKYILMDTAGCSIYSVDSGHTKFKPASRNDLVGKDLWVVSIGDMARGIFFEK